MKAIEQLKKEHKAVKVMLRVLEKITKNLEAGDSVDPEHLGGIVEFFQVFVDRCHHVKEENMLFVAMQQATDPGDGDRIGALLKDHVSGRNYVRDLSHAVKHFQDGDMAAVPEILRWARAYIVLLIQHIDIEDNILYPLANERLSAQQQEELLEQFNKLEEKELGIGKHEEFHVLIEKLKGIYL